MYTIQNKYNSIVVAIHTSFAYSSWN